MFVLILSVDGIPTIAIGFPSMAAAETFRDALDRDSYDRADILLQRTPAEYRA